MLNKNSSLTKKIEQFQKEKTKSTKSKLKQSIKEYNGINLLSDIIELDGSSIKNILFELKAETNNFIGILGGIDNDKCTLSIIASDNIIKEKKIHAGDIIREVSKNIQGGGGGQAFFGTAGGKNPSGLKNAIKEVIEKL